jgi:hypothetical protein
MPSLHVLLAVKKDTSCALICSGSCPFFCWLLSILSGDVGGGDTGEGLRLLGGAGGTEFNLPAERGGVTIRGGDDDVICVLQEEGVEQKSLEEEP